MIPAEKPHLLASGSTHPGMSGKNNEDSYSVSAFRLSDPPNSAVLLAVVADGIGGHRAGEVASAIAAEKIRQVVASGEATDPVQTLKDAIQTASQEILAQAETDPARRGMGSTCACALIIDDRLYTATVGDSRIYLIRGQEIHQISIDHTWVQEAIDAGLLDPSQARTHPNAHVIRRHLGSQTPVEPDVRLRLQPGESDDQALANQGLRLLPGDQLLLCSDGLTDLALDEEILAASRNKDQEKVNQALTDLANRRGGHDNITIILLRVPGAASMLAPTVRIQPRRKPWLAIAAGAALAGLLLLVAALGGFYAWNWVNQSRATTTGETATATTAVLETSAITRAAPQTPRLLTTSTPARATPLGPATATPLPGWVPSPSPSLTSPPVTYFPSSTTAP